MNDEVLSLPEEKSRAWRNKINHNSIELLLVLTKSKWQIFCKCLSTELLAEWNLSPCQFSGAEVPTRLDKIIGLSWKRANVNKYLRIFRNMACMSVHFVTRDRNGSLIFRWFALKLNFKISPRRSYSIDAQWIQIFFPVGNNTSMNQALVFIFCIMIRFNLMIM